jgi:hypothetical protein
MQNDIIYLTVRGDEFKEMAAHCVRSLRGIGQFDGEILVVTPAMDDHLRGISNIATVLIHSFQTHIMMDRLFAMDLIDASRYRSMLALDADILAMRDVAPLFDSDDEVLYMEEYWQTIADRPLGDTMYTHGMSRDERQRFSACRPINVGHYTIAGSIFADVRRIYHNLVDASGELVFGSDQAAFNLMIRRELVCARPYGPFLVANATKVNEKSWPQYSIVHFAGFENRLPTIRNWAKRIETHDHPKVLEVQEESKSTSLSQENTIFLGGTPNSAKLSIVFSNDNQCDGIDKIVGSIRQHLRSVEPKITPSFHYFGNGFPNNCYPAVLSLEFDFLTLSPHFVGIGPAMNHVFSQVRTPYLLFIPDYCRISNPEKIAFITESILIMESDSNIGQVKLDSDESICVQDRTLHAGPFQVHPTGVYYYVQNPSMPKGQFSFLPSLVRVSMLRALGPFRENHLLEPSRAENDYAQRYATRWVCAKSPRLNVFEMDNIVSTVYADDASGEL